MTIAEFRALCEQHVLMDCAFGTNLRAKGMPIGLCMEVWIEEHPEALTALFEEYIAAGSQIISAPTASMNRVRMESFDLLPRMEELTESMLRLAHAAIGNRALICGTAGTLIRRDLEYREMFEIYSEQYAAIVRHGVDLLGAFTMVTLEESLAAVEAAKAVSDLPMMCSMTVQADGSLHFGGNVYDAAQALEAIGADAVGINCAVSPDQLETVVRILRESVSIPIIVKPNAGLPLMTPTGDAIYDMDADRFAKMMKPLIDLGANIVGGCCGTTPEYIAKLKTIL